jgi:hypothetical protein
VPCSTLTLRSNLYISQVPPTFHHILDTSTFLLTSRYSSCTLLSSGACKLSYYNNSGVPILNCHTWWMQVTATSFWDGTILAHFRFYSDYFKRLMYINIYCIKACRRWSLLRGSLFLFGVLYVVWVELKMKYWVFSK